MLVAVSLCIPTQAAYANPIEDAGNAIASFLGLNSEEEAADTRATTGAINPVADPNTMDDFNKVLQSGSGAHSTQNIGRIWSDKTVSTSGITLDLATDGVADQTIGMEINGTTDTSDFLVALSALSSASNTTTMTSTPLDIILVLDASGSMDDSLGSYAYVEAYDIETWGGPNYYGKNADGTYSTIERRWQGGGYWEFNGQRVEPKTSADDPDTNHIQFYVRQNLSKMDALKTAVNNFIDVTAAQNDKITDTSKQHNISVVKYADDTYNYEYGNDRMENNNWYNYTQRLNPLTAYTSGNVQTIKNDVNALVASGGTAADYGLSMAQTEMTANGREGAKKVIIFFTDGEPNHGNGFNSSVATDAIEVAGAFKQAGGLVFSIGVVNGADPGAEINTSTRTNINAYLHSVSSNYPNATGWSDNRWNMGDRTANSEYYYAASNADELNGIFSKIQESVTSGLQSPTDVSSGNALYENGYITFTDELGDYMKVDDFKSVVYAGERFTEVTSNTVNGVTTYTFKGTAGNNGLPDEGNIYNPGDMSKIIITVTHGANEKTGDTVTVRVPASLIPLRKFNVDTDNMTMTVSEALPIRIFYGVSLKDGVAKKITNPTAELDGDLKTYIADNLDSDGNVQFYSNAVPTDKSQGTTTTLFDPAASNNFYFNSNEIKLYMDEGLTVPAKLTNLEDIKNATFYFSESYYVENKTAKDDDTTDNVYPCVLKTDDVTSFSGAQMAVDQSDWGYDGNGQMYIKAGGPRISTLTALHGDKTSNPTETATTVIDPTWVSREDPSAGVQVYLGNNGRLELDVPGTLAVEKNIEAADGFTLGDTQKNADFDFGIQLTAPANETLKDKYWASVRLADGTEIDKFEIEVKNGMAHHSIKGDQTLFIYGLPSGTTYTVLEGTKGKVPGGFTEDESRRDKSTGTILANDTITAVFTNIYKANPISWPEEDLTVSKTLNGRPTQNGDVFNFTIVGTATGSAGLTAPMPSNATNGAFQITMGAGVDAPAVENYVLGKIEFTKPGTYTYTIDEAQGDLAGVNYELGYYTLTVIVADDGKGALSIASSDCKYTVNTTSTAHDVSNAMNFTNTYKIGEVTEPLRGGKILLGRDLERNEFQFQLTEITDTDPNNVKTTYTAANAVDDYKSILPTGVEKIGGIVTNGAVDASDLRAISFGNITFTGESIGHTYTYTIQEIKDNPGIPGVTYDSDLERVVTVTVESETTANGEALIVKVLSDDKTEASEYKSNFTFTNTYQPESLTLTGDAFVKGEKTFAGRDAAEDLMFSLVPVSKDAEELMGEGVDRDEVVTANELKKDTKAYFNFGDMTFTKAGTYIFDVMEVLDGIDDASHMKWDRHVAKVTINVKEELDENKHHTGRLVLDGPVIYDNNTTSASSEVSSRTDAAVFLNVYTASADYPDIHVVKQLTGRDTKALGANEFNFTITGEAGEGTTAEQANAKLAEGDKAFPNSAPTTGTTTVSMQKLPALTFNQDDAGKTYVYLVDEVEPTDATTNADGTITKAGVTYDRSKYRVTIYVNDNGDGTMSTPTAVQKLDKDGNDVGDSVEYTSTADISTHATMTFTNKYKPASVDVADVSFNKIVEGRDWLEGETFEFTMSKLSYNNTTDDAAKANMPNPANTVVTLANSADNGYTENQTVPVQGFGTLTFDQPGVYVYQVAETHASETINGLTYDSTPAKVTITVTDNGEGQLVARVSYSNRDFNNVYSSDASFDEAFNFAVTKQLNGHAMTSEQFEFKMEAVDGPVATDATAAETAAKLGFDEGQTEDTFKSPASETADNNAVAADGDIVNVLTALGENMKFTQADSGKTFSVVFRETNQDGQGYTIDKATYRLDITPSDDETTGAMTLAIKVTKTTVNENGLVTDSVVLDKKWTEGAAQPVDVILSFVNEYSATGTMPVNGKKDIDSGINPWNGNLAGFEFSIVADETHQQTVDAVAARTVILPNNAVSVDSPDDSNDDGAFSFTDGVKFTKPGTYKFIVAEVDPGEGNRIPGIGYTKETRTIEVEVTDNHNGTLKVEVANNANTGMTFTNTYTTTDATVADIKVTKKVEGHQALTPFNFTMEAADDATKTLVNGGNVLDATGANPFADGKMTKTTSDKMVDGASEELNFGALTFKKVGTYTFTITESESKGSVPAGWKYDGHTYKVTVDVKDVASILTPTFTVVEGEPVFSNTFGTSTTYADQGGLLVTKTLTGRAMAEGQFSFTIEGDDDASKAKLTAEGDKSFKNAAPNDKGVAEMSKLGTLGFNQKDLGKTYNFTIAETDTNGAGYTYDSTPVKVKIEVKEEAAGGEIYTITTVTKGNDTKVYTSEGDKKETAVAPFANSYTATGSLTGDNLISVSKTLAGRDWKANETYAFELTAVTEGAPMPEGDGAKLTIGKPAKGATNTGDFGTITYDQDDIDKEKGYKDFIYKVVETTNSGDANMTYSKAEYEVTIRVTDDGEGNLVPTITSVMQVKNDAGEDTKASASEPVAFTNTYKPAPQPEKDVQGNNGNSGNGQMVGVGDELTYTINWTNDAVSDKGEAAAANITITDMIPVGTEYVENSAKFDSGKEGTAKTEDVDGGKQITWTIENADANATGTVSFKVRVTEDAAAMIDPITNKAEVQVGNNAPKQSNETTNTVPKKAVTSPDLDNGTIKVGQTLTYVINYRNDETEPATITVTDKVPAGTTFVDGSAGEGVEPAADGTLTWVIEGVEPGAPGVVSFQVKVNESAVGATDPITNQATVKIGDRDPGYKTNTTKTTVNSGDLKIAKAVAVEGSGVVAPDATFTIKVDLKDAENNTLTGNYNYEIKNAADGTAVQESFMLFFSRAVTGTITNGGTIQLKAGQYVEITGLPEGAQYTVTETPVPSGFTASYDDAQTGSIVANGTAATTVTNTYEVDELVYSGSANLKVSKTLVGREMTDADKFTMQIAAGTYTAPGASEATEGFELPMPAATTVDVTKANNATAAFGDIKFTTPGTYTYEVSEVPGNEVGMSYSPVTYTVTITVTDNGDGTLKAETTYSPTLAQGENAAMNFINSYQEKTVDGTSGAEGTAQVGDKLTYTIKYANTESATATVVVTDKVPTGTTFVSASEGGVYDQATNTVTWTFNNVVPGDEGKGSVTLTVEVSEDAVVESIENQAWVKVGDHDPDATTKVDTPLGKDGSLVISKTVTVEDNQGLDAAAIQGNAEFTFTVALENAAGDALAGTYNYKGTGVADGTIANNGTVTLKHGQSIAVEGLPAGATYTVTETAVDGFTQTAPVEGEPAEAKPATGAIAAEKTANADFTNHYKVDDVTLTGDTALAIQKTFTGRNWLDTDKFDFTVAKVSYNKGADDAAEANMPDISGTQIGKPADGGETNSAKLADVTFTKAGTYVYEIAETKGDLGGVTYDENTVTVTIAVTDNGKGELEANVKYGDSDTATAAAFTNTYGSVVPEGKPISTDGLFTKVFTGRTWTEDDDFRFIIKPQNGAPAPANLEVVVDGKTTDPNENPGTQFGFGSIAFTFDHIKDATPAADGSRTKTFEYRVYEEKGTIAGVTYDEHVALLTITVTDNGKGEMSGASAITAVTRADNSIFTNVYNSSLDYVAAGGLSITKTLDGRAMANEQFGFTVTPANKESADKLGLTEGANEFKAPAAEDGKAATINLLADKTLEFTQDDAGKTYSYTIVETLKGGAGYTNDEAERGVTIEVKDNGDATLTVTTTVTGGKDGKQVFTYTTNQTPVAAAVVPFVNSYYAETGDDEATGAAVVKTTKTLNGRDLTAGEFSFQIKPQAGGDAIATATNDVNGNVVFTAMTYNTETLGTPNGTKAGKPYWELKYTASEVTTGLPGGVSATTPSFDFTVTVVDNGDGTLTATPTLPEGNGFVNTYSTDGPIPMDLKGSKVLDAADGLTPGSIEGKFIFTVEAENGGPLPASTTATNDADGNVDFGKIEFTLADLNKALKATTTVVEGDANAEAEDATLDSEESTEATALDAETRVGAPRSFDFVYTITESGSADGVTNDTETKTVTFRVTDDGAGKLTVDRLGNDTAAFVFTNTYSVTPNNSSVTDQISITKKLTGRDMVEGEFTFELVEKVVDGDVVTENVVATGANTADGKVTFTSIEYTEPGEHDYLVREVNPGTANGVTYDARTFRIHTSVTDNGDGTLTVTHVALDRDAISFVNTYEPAATAVTFGATKVLEGAELKEGQFTFEILDSKGEVFRTTKNDATGQVIFPTIEFTEVGTYTYTIVEKNDGQANVTYDDATFKVVVEVTDDGKGYLHAAVAEVDGTPAFKNTYTTPAEPVDPGKPAEPQGPTFAKTNDGAATLAGGLAALAAAACAGIAAAVFKLRRGAGSFRRK